MEEVEVEVEERGAKKPRVQKEQQAKSQQQQQASSLLLLSTTTSTTTFPSPLHLPPSTLHPAAEGGRRRQ